MKTFRFISTCVATLLSGAATAQQSSAGNAVAEQLAQSSLRMVGSLLAVLAVVALCSWGLRRWRDRQSVDSESIEIVSGISLGSKERVVLLRIADEQVLVGLSPAGMQSLHVVRACATAQSDEARQVSVDAPSNPVSPSPALPATFDLNLGAAQ